jgi:hypothetical protein
MTRTKAFAAFGAVALIAAACSGDRAPLTPQAAAPAAELSADSWRQPAAADPADIGQETTLLRTTPLAADLTVSQSIGPSGGALAIPGAGLRVYVPRGALNRTITITATALKGDQVAYEFGPHGTRFALPLVMMQATAGTNADNVPTGAVLKLAYFTSPGALDPVGKKVRFAELMPQLGLVLDDAIAFPVWHFSGWSAVWTFHDRDR